MPKQKTDDLIQLIKSLSRAEKRHFRLFVRRNQASDDILFLKLFDFLDKHQGYEEALILKKLPSIKKRQLSNLKAHLYKQLLISLRLLHTNHNEDIQIREAIDYARVLYRKSLYQQALDILAKAKEKAYQSNFLTLALEILTFEKHIEGQHITRSIEGRAEELALESTTVSSALSASNQYSNLSLQLYARYLRLGYVRNEKDHEELRQFFFQQLPQIDYTTLDILGKIYHCQSYIWYYYTSQDFPNCYRHASRWVQLFHAQPQFKKTQAPIYLKGLHNLLNVLFNNLQYDQFNATLQELEKFPQSVDFKTATNTESLYYLYHYIHSIKKHFLEGSFSEGLELVPELMDIIREDRYNWDEHRVMVFYYRIACLYFGSGDNEAAIDYLNLIINQKNPDYRKDIQCFARILNLIAHYEMGNVLLVEYQVKSVYRFLSKVEDLHAIQREIFKFLRKTPKLNKTDLKQAFRELKSQLLLHSNAPFERRPFLYLDIISWLEAKIEGVAVQDVARKKFLVRQSLNS